MSHFRRIKLPYPCFPLRPVVAIAADHPRRRGFPEVLCVSPVVSPGLPTVVQCVSKRRRVNTCLHCGRPFVAIDLTRLNADRPRSRIARPRPSDCFNTYPRHSRDATSLCPKVGMRACARMSNAALRHSGGFPEGAAYGYTNGNRRVRSSPCRYRHHRPCAG